MYERTFACTNDAEKKGNCQRRRDLTRRKDFANLLLCDRKRTFSFSLKYAEEELVLKSLSLSILICQKVVLHILSDFDPSV